MKHKTKQILNFKTIVLKCTTVFLLSIFVHYAFAQAPATAPDQQPAPAATAPPATTPEATPPPATPPSPAKSVVPIDHSYKPLILKLNDDGSKFIRFITWHQMWFTANDNNIGTVDANGESKTSTVDLGIRRSRLLLLAQVSPRFLILTHFGINNQSFINGGNTAGADAKKPQLYIHDAWTEFAVFPKKLHVGAGLHYWNGVSRLSNASTLNFMALDAPQFNWVNIETTDQFARQFGIYLKGQLGKFDYRIAFNKPFAIGVKTTDTNWTNASTAWTTTSRYIQNDNWAYAGYFKYMFFDQESNTLPFEVGSYLGAKKILNVGLGYYYHPGAFGIKKDKKLSKVDQLNLGFDVFYEQPLSKAMALSVYSVYYYNDYGENFSRNVGILNNYPTVGGTDPKKSIVGGGNMQVTLGTGSIWYTQVGFLLPKFNNGQALMPYIAFTYKDIKAYEAAQDYEFGVNYFINGHNAKVTAAYVLRPTYYASTTGKSTLGDHKGQFIVQMHIFL